MPMKRILFNQVLFVIITLSLFACTNTPNKDTIETYNIEFDSQYIDGQHKSFSVSFLPLETTEECIIGSVTDFQHISKGYVVLDAQISKKVVMFGLNGQYISNIGRLGNAPGEYVHPMSFSISPDEKEIAVIDGDRMRVIFYSLLDFSYIGEREIPFSAAHMEYLEDGNFIWYNKSKNIDNILVKTNADITIEKKILERDFFSGYTIGMTRKMYKVGNCIQTYTPFSPVLYEIQNDTITKITNFTFGDDRFPPLSFFEEESKKGNYIPALQSSEYISYYDIFENDESFCVPFFSEGVMYYGFHDKQNGTSFKITQKDLQNKLKVGLYSNLIGVSLENEFISLLNPDMIRGIYKEQPQELSEELQEIIGNGKDEDNPILLFLKMQ